MYTAVQTDISKRCLKTLATVIPRPHCLIGGWSVYLLVNESYEEETGGEYQGSRDIDLGFHFDPQWDKKQFDNSPFGKAISQIKKLGFQGVAYRFFKQFHAIDGHELTEQEIGRLQQYDIFKMFIDLFVDSNDPKKDKLAGFPVADELLLTRVFSGNESMTKKLDGLEITVPDPQVQMEMKVRSFPGRREEDKRRKDLTDLCALLLYFPSEAPVIKDEDDGPKVRSSYKRELAKTTDPEWEAISKDLSVSVADAKRVANRIG